MKHSIHTTDIENGAAITMIHAPAAALVEVRLYFRGGFLYFDRNKYHLPHILEHLILGSSLKSGDEKHVTQGLQKLGAVANATTDYDYITVQLTAPLATYQEALMLVLQSVYSNVFENEDIAIEKQVILREIYERYDGPGSAVAAETINDLIYGERMIGQKEEVENVEALESADIEAAYKQFIRPDNMIILLAGNISEASRKSLLELFKENTPLSTTSQKEAKRQYNLETPQKSLLVDKPYGDGVNGSFMFSAVIPNDKTVSDRALALRSIVFNMFFGTAAAVIPTELRQRGLIYSADFDASTIQDKKVLACSLYAGDERLPEAIAEFYSILKTYSVIPLPSGAYENIKLFGLAVLPTLQETASDLIDWYEPALLAGRSLTGVEHDMEILRTVTEQELADTVRDCFIIPKNHWSIIASETNSWSHDFMKSTLEAVELTKTADQTIEELTEAVKTVSDNRKVVATNRNSLFWLVFALLCIPTTISLLTVANFPNPGQTGTISMLDFALVTNRHWLIASTIGALFGALISGNFIDRKYGRSIMVAFSAIAAVFYWWAVLNYFKDVGVQVQPWIEDLVSILQPLFFGILVPRAIYLVIKYRLVK